MCGSTRTLQYLNLGRQPRIDGALAPLGLQACLACKVSHATHSDITLPHIVLDTPIVVGDVSWLLSTLAFEHVSHINVLWWSVSALKEYARANGVTLREASASGGELRAVFTRDAASSESLTKSLVAEHHDLTRSAYMRFSDRVTQRIADLNRKLSAYNGTYAGIGASQATVTLLNCMSIESYPSVIYDVLGDQSYGWSVLPGTKIPILPAPDLRTVALPLVRFGADPGAKALRGVEIVSV